MKINSTVVLVALTVFSAISVLSCIKEESVKDPEDEKVQVLTAEIEQDAGTKTYPGSMTGSKYSTRWSKGDVIKVFDDSANADFYAGDPSEDGRTVEFTSYNSSLNLKNALTAVYPGANWDLKKGIFLYYGNGSYSHPVQPDNSYLPMIATRESGASDALSFKALFSCFRLTVKNATVTSVSLSCPDGYVIAGYFKLENSALVAYGSTKVRTVSLTGLGAGVECGSEGVDFFIPCAPLPAGVELTFTVNGSEKKITVPSGGLAAGKMILVDFN